MVDRSNAEGCVTKGRVRSRSRTELKWFDEGQSWGRFKMKRRALRVMRPAREKKRRRKVLVVITSSPKPMRVLQQERL